ncbi:MAG: TonB-dependent receptor, partial [Acidobacteria bacterium]|nr:TonB-dependent receptor [Acidobacteriota bacterium]
GANDRAFIHFRTDHGTQATLTSPFSPSLNATSTQPQYEGQFNETHTFGPNTVNQFIAAASWYAATFNLTNPSAALQLVPFEIGFSGALSRLGRDFSVFPQGRRSTQYQFIDDLSHTMGKHNVKVGLNFTRNDISNLDPGIGTLGLATTTLSNFFSGTVSSYAQSFVPRLEQPIARYGLGFYAQDEWAVTQRLKLTLAMRFDHNSNPICVTNCFGNLTGPFESITHDVTIPYNQVIRTGQAQMITGTRWPRFDYEPRIGFAFTPFGPGRNTVIRGGIGMFSDFLPATISDQLMNNSPLNNRFTLTGLPLTPALQTTAAAANAAFLSGFNSGGTFATLSTSPTFVPPSFFTLGPIMRDPNYAEWNLELQQGIGSRASVSINYVGNHGYHELIQNYGLNSFCDVTPALPGETAAGTCATALGATAGFPGLPLSPADPRFGTVAEAQSVGVSNYNGVTVSFKQRFSSLQIQANYTWSHALDEISNSGLLAYNFNTNSSILNQINPFCLRCNNYGNADYDVRHNFNLNYVFNSPDRYGPHGVLGGWVLSGTLFVRTGLPYSVIDSAATGTLAGYNYGTSPAGGAGPQLLAGIIGTPSLSCPGGITGYNPNGAPCEVASDFTGTAVPTLGFLNQRRNQFRGPGFLDTDFSIIKNFHIPKWEGGTLGVGASFFNILNHPNFDQPVADVSSPLFGTVQSTVAPPTTPFGAFIGSSASFRIIQLNARITF